MNDNVNNYVQTKIDCIDDADKKGKKEEIAIGTAAFLETALFLGLALLTHFHGTGFAGGFVSCAATIILNSTMGYMIANNTRKGLDKKKKHLLELKDKENILFEEYHTEKIASINKHGLAIDTKDTKYESLKKIVNAFRTATYIASIFAVINPSIMWLPIAEMIMYSSLGFLNVSKHASLEKEKTKRDNLLNDVEVDHILRRDNGEDISELEEELKNVDAPELGKVKIEVFFIPISDLSEKERMAEMIVEDMANEPSQEDEKNKVNIKK